MNNFGYPLPQGLYDPQHEHDSCGVGFIVHIKNKKSHDIVKKGLQLLCNLNHRGAIGADPETGDGAGILVQIPDAFLREETAKLGFVLPAEGRYGVATMFLPHDDKQQFHCVEAIQSIVSENDLIGLGWRDVPIDTNYVGKQAAEAMPVIKQLFLAGNGHKTQQELERLLYVARNEIRNSLLNTRDFVVTSMSTRTLAYKGMLRADQMDLFFPDLADERFVSAIALSHTRFPTNTFPRWDLAQPFRYLAHNGEINTLRGNINWMRSRQEKLESPLYENIRDLLPIIVPSGSDSACLDNVLEFLVLSGYSLSHAMMMLVPEAWETQADMSPEKRAFYEYHEHLMEPWDGPAALAFTDGIQIGATLDRNGLRPARYVVTKDDFVIMASEVGAVDIDPEDIVSKGRLQPGKMFLVDTQLGRIISDEELKQEICGAQPYATWLNDNVIPLDSLPTPADLPKSDPETLLERQKIFGYTTEDMNILLTPMIRDGEEATGSMGNDAPLAALSDRPQLLYGYFKQIFAQVSNPPIDSIREEMVMSMTSHLGGEGNILSPEPGHAKLIKIDGPILTNAQFAKLRHHEKAAPISLLFPASEGASGLQKALDRICAEAASAIRSGKEYLILSDRGVGRDHVPIPALLAVGAVHHHLIREKLRSSSSLILETGEAREIAHFCLLIGYGVGAINPYLAFETFEQILSEGTLPEELTYEKAIKNYLKAIRKGMFKVFAKMGISTIQSYRGAQIFEAIGLSEDVVHEYFAGTPSKISGVTVEVLGEECLRRHASAYVETPDLKNTLSVGGQYFWRRRGEYHQVNPMTTLLLQEAAQKNSREVFKKFSDIINEQSQRLATPRSLLTFKQGTPVPLEEVEPAKEIVRRFATGAMSLGSISSEAHQTLAVAMNRIGGRSNSGEGGEDPQRFHKRENGDWPVSRIKQVASGRFGVTIHYLVNCVELQIKIAQGAKPGEGGQLPGKKVSQEIAKVRHSTPGVTLISPPPHHDIYSIEDLAQLIFDLKNANPKARITVKLVSEAGVGTIAAGVAKTHADLIVIAGHDGGTGASPLTSIKYAGVPWELGLSEAHQTLLLNRLRGRVRLQTDGQLKTGRDVAIAAMLGAEEFGFSTAPLITIGCVMMRKCHLNTCPVGIATQDPELRKKFVGQPEHVINFFFMVAEEVREIMAKCGFRSFSEMVGRSDCLEQRSDITHWKAKHVDLSNLLKQIPVGEGDTRYCTQEQDHGLNEQIDHELIALAKEAIEQRKPVKIEMPVKNIHRAIGTMLSGEIALAHGAEGLPDHTIHCQLTGSAGQSFGAFLARGVTLELEGDANDYTGKGLSGGKLIVYPPKRSTFKADENILIGNTVLYGATGGEAFFSGIAGERFGVRNSGANAIVEGVGDHGCEYMTGGRVIVLGHTGRNFAAGMSGGIAYVFDEKGYFTQRCNQGMVELGPISQVDEAKWVKEMIQRHLQYTQSERASKLLEDWDNTLQKFVRVMPTEYRLVLEQMNSQAA